MFSILLTSFLLGALPRIFPVISRTIPTPEQNMITATINPIIPSALLIGVNADISSAAIVAAVAMQSFMLSCFTAFKLRLSVFLYKTLLKKAIYSFMPIAAASAVIYQMLKLISEGLIIFITEFFPSSKLIKNIKNDTARAVIYSNLP